VHGLETNQFSLVWFVFGFEHLFGHHEWSAPLISACVLLAVASTKYYQMQTKVTCKQSESLLQKFYRQFTCCIDDQAVTQPVEIFGWGGNGSVVAGLSPIVSYRRTFGPIYFVDFGEIDSLTEQYWQQRLHSLNLNKKFKFVRAVVL